MESEWGHMAVVKIKSMLQDIEISKELNTDFHNHLTKTKTSLIYEFNIQVLTQGCWPDTDYKKIEIPSEFSLAKSTFEKYYQHKYNGKQLTWVMALGDGEVAVTFDQKYILVVSSYQISILLLMNKKESLKYEEIKHILGIPEHDLLANMLALTSRVGILAKSLSTEKVIHILLFESNRNRF